MSDSAIGFLLVGVGIIVVLGIVFAIVSRTARPPGPDGRVPIGVHLPSPSFLPAVISFGMALIGAGLAFRSEGEIAQPFLAIPGIVVLVLGIVFWVRAANREWHETELRSNDDAAH